MTTTLSRQTSASDLNSNYRGTADSEIPPSPKSPTFAKSLHSRKASFQISAWLGRGTGQGPQSPSLKTMQISDPQPTNPYDAAGKGAAVIRTPQQVLSSPFPRSETPNEKDELFDGLPVVDIRAPTPAHAESIPPVLGQSESPAHRRDSPVPRRDSPIMRQELPAPDRASPAPSGFRSLHSSKSYSQLQTSPRVAPLPLNLASSRQPLLRAALRPPSPTKSTSSNSQFLPLLPPPRQTSISAKDTPTVPLLPPFHPVLLSAVPTRPVPPSQVIVTLETSTVTQRTTVATLASRPSRLATYLQALVPIAGTKEASSDDTFSSLFAAHLAQAGIVPQLQSSHNGPIHIFIDRPSAPYAHILTYLRSSGSSPSTLPRAASLALSAEPIRVEALCELRDEAKFLELTELVELCDKELRSRAPKLRSTASSSSLREYKFGSGSDASGARNSGPEATDSRLRDYRFGVPVESLQEEEGEGEHAVEVPPVVYEKRGSHAGMVTTVPPRNVQTVNSQIGTRILRSPPSQPRMRTISEVRYTTSGDGKTWI